MSDKIILSDMEFRGHHGCSESERQIGQTFKVDLTLELDLSVAAASDKLSDTVDYVAVYNVVKSIVGGKPRNLLETVADEVAATLLEHFPTVNAVSLTLAKPAAPAIGFFAAAAVSITRRRNA